MVSGGTEEGQYHEMFWRQAFLQVHVMFKNIVLHEHKPSNTYLEKKSFKWSQIFRYLDPCRQTDFS